MFYRHFWNEKILPGEEIEQSFVDQIRNSWGYYGVDVTKCVTYDVLHSIPNSSKPNLVNRHVSHFILHIW